ncbi:Glutarate-semialdehyde dehydrogenase DavD [compost metagenome]
MVVFKPRSQTPYSAPDVAELAERARIPKGVFSVVTGSTGEFGGTASLEANAILAPLNLPVYLHAQACKLLHAIGGASGLDNVQRAADRAEGFALGVETLRALNPGDVECLYLAFDYAEQVRQAELGG